MKIYQFFLISLIINYQSLYYARKLLSTAYELGKKFITNRFFFSFKKLILILDNF